MGAFDQQILEASAKFPKPADKTYQYGTAGVSLPRSLTLAFDITKEPHSGCLRHTTMNTLARSAVGPVV